MNPLFDPQHQPAPDSFGITKHPDLARFATQSTQDNPAGLNTAALAAEGIEIRVIRIDDDAPGVLDAYSNCGDMFALLHWTPLEPIGTGWQLVAIYDTERDPVAVFARPADADGRREPTTQEQHQVDPGRVRACRAHYRTAARIHTQAPWKSEVEKIAADVGAQNVPYPTLIHRANKILIQGPIYRVRRGDQLIVLGADLAHDGGYSVLSAGPAVTPP